MGFQGISLPANIPPQIIGLLIIWDLIFKGFGLWHSAQNRQKNWFIAILVLNTMGILPIIYLKFFQNKK